MLAYLVRRLAWAVFVLLGVSVAVFFIIFLTGDPAQLLAAQEAKAEDVELIRREMGFDQPLHVQYARFLSGAVRGDFGSSLRHRQPALPLVLERLPATFQLTGAAMAFALLVAIPLGILSAVKRNTGVDTACMITALFGQCMPTFWLGIMLILVFAVYLHWLPAFGRTEATSIILPAITLGAYSMARTARLTRSNMLEVLAKDYMRTARAKGLSERVVVLRHAFKNAAIPIVTLVGLETGVLLGGAVITETVFAWPGVGLLAIQSVINKDVPLVQAIVFVVASIFVAVNLLTDLLYVVLDPRIRLTR